MVPRLLGQEDQRQQQRTKLDRSKRFLGTLRLQMSGGTMKRRSDSCATEMSRERSKGGSDLCREAARCHAYLSMKHAVAKQAANKMVLREVDKVFFDLRISLAVVTISAEEGEIDILARSGIWPGDFCAPSIFVKATCSAFQPELET